MQPQIQKVRTLCKMLIKPDFHGLAITETQFIDENSSNRISNVELKYGIGV